jgi:hypothetical protein
MQSLKTRDYYLACRRDKTILESLVDTANYKGDSIQTIADRLGMELSEAQIRKLKEMGYDLT